MSAEKTIRIYGHSDDCILVVGDVPGCTQLDVCDATEGYVELSTGEVFFVEYTDDGLWKIKLVQSGEAGRATSFTILPATDPESDRYSDQAAVTGPMQWVELWHNYPPGARDLREKVSSILCRGEEDSFDPDALLTADELKRVYDLAREVRARNWNA